MSNHIDKEILQHDPVVDTYAKAADYYFAHKNIILGIVAAIVVVIGSAVAYDFYSKSQETKALQLLSYAERSFEALDFEKALKGDDIEQTPGFEDIVLNFGSTKAGNLARYYAALSEYNQGNVETALAYMKSFKAPKGVLGVNTIGFFALLHNDLGNYAEAAKQYEIAAGWVENDATTPLYLFKSATAYRAAGNAKKALEVSNIVLNKYSTSPEVGNIQKLVAGL